MTKRLFEENEKVDRLFATLPSEVLERYCSENDVTEQEAQEVFRELVKFLLASRSARGSLIPSRDVDEAWHCFILFTRLYPKWCRTQLGGVVHHAPLKASPVKNASPPEYERSLEYMRSQFEINEERWRIGAWSGSDPR